MAQPATLAAVSTLPSDLDTSPTAALRALCVLMAPSDGGTAVSTPGSGGFSFGRPAQWAGATVDAPLSSFRSTQHGRKRESSDSPQRSAAFGETACDNTDCLRVMHLLRIQPKVAAD